MMFFYVVWIYEPYECISCTSVLGVSRIVDYIDPLFLCVPVFCVGSAGHLLEVIEKYHQLCTLCSKLAIRLSLLTVQKLDVTYRESHLESQRTRSPQSELLLHFPILI